MRIGAIEAGGTKFVCGIGNEQGIIENRISFPTAEPERTLEQVIAYFEHNKVFDVPFGWDTDVNAAALGEARWGAAKGLDSCVYYTIGNGIGTGVFAEGKLVHGLVHPEGGHVLTRRHPEDRFTGTCPYHGDCLEGRDNSGLCGALALGLQAMENQ